MGTSWANVFVAPLAMLFVLMPVFDAVTLGAGRPLWLAGPPLGKDIAAAECASRSTATVVGWLRTEQVGRGNRTEAILGIKALLEAFGGLCASQFICRGGVDLACCESQAAALFACDQ